MEKDVKYFVMRCEICKRCKYGASASPGLLQPLPITERLWQHITMNFIKGLSFSHGFIYMIVNRLNKSTHFMTLIHPYSATEIAQCFLDNVFKLHDFPNFITSDKGAIFVS